VDTNTLIYRVEQVEPYLSAAAPLWDALDAGQREVATSELTLLEVLVKPLQTADQKLADLFRQVLFRTTGLHCLPVDRPVLEQAAQIRASYRLRTPDAIHAATALREGCSQFVTNDPQFRKVPGLSVAVLSEIAAS
jgi:predicted nucleic acid-binding protein